MFVLILLISTLHKWRFFMSHIVCVHQICCNGNNQIVMLISPFNAGSCSIFIYRFWQCSDKCFFIHKVWFWLLWYGLILLLTNACWDEASMLLCLHWWLFHKWVETKKCCSCNKGKASYNIMKLIKMDIIYHIISTSKPKPIYALHMWHNKLWHFIMFFDQHQIFSLCRELYYHNI